MNEPYSNLASHYADLGRIRLHYMRSVPPGGKPVLLLHGFPGFWYGWRRQIPALAEAGFDVTAPDQRGYNLSETPKGVAAYAMSELVEDVVSLLDHLSLPQVYLAGHDWGAAVAWAVAMLHPERVKKLAILNVPHPNVMLTFLLRNPKQMIRSWYIAFFQIPGLADWLMSANRYNGVLNMLKSSGQPGTFTPEDLEEYRKAYTNAGGLTGMINWYRALARYRLHMPADSRLELPVLIMWGKKDVALSAQMAEESLKFCPRGDLVFFEHATHWVQHDEAEAVNGKLVSFFSD